MLTPPAEDQLIAEALREAHFRASRLSSDFPPGHVRSEDGTPVPFHPGQVEADESKARFTFVFAGSQGGKTCYGPWWLRDRIAEFGMGDYLAVTANFDLFKLKMLPEMRVVFEDILGIGRYWSGDKVIELCDPATGRFLADRADDPMWGRIILRSARSSGGLESATAKAAWLDECGQDDFTIDDWEAVNRRLSLNQGPVLGTTTLYNRGWVKSRIYDKFKDGDPDYNVIQFPSFINPAFPREEYDRIASILPKWKLNMFYRGEFDIPEGLIYDCFLEDEMTFDPFPDPDGWKTWACHDFGGVNTAGLRVLEDPVTKVLWVVDEYHEGKKTAAGHAKDFIEWKPSRAYGGAWSEDQWRLEFGAGGYPIVKPPIKDVEIGIDVVYAVIQSDGIRISKRCLRLIDELNTYSRKLDREGRPTEEIKDKNVYHLLDALRYLLVSIRRKFGKVKVRTLG